MKKINTDFEDCIEVGDNIVIFYKTFFDREGEKSFDGVVLKINDIGLMIISSDDIKYMREKITSECIDDKTACAFFIPWSNIHSISKLVYLKDNDTLTKFNWGDDE